MPMICSVDKLKNVDGAKLKLDFSVDKAETEEKTEKKVAKK